MNWQSIRSETITQLKQWYSGNHTIIQLLSLITLAGAIGTVASLLLDNLLPAKFRSSAHPAREPWLALIAGATGGAVGIGLTQQRVQQLQTQLDDKQAQVTAIQQEIVQLQAESTRTVATVEEPQDQPVPASSSVPDQLESIHGIGKVTAQRLNQAGIYTFAELAAQTPDQLRAMMGPARNASLIKPESWIAEAQQRLTAS